MQIFKCKIHKGNPRFCAASYAISVDYLDGTRKHVEYFFGHDGRKVRSEALRFAKKIIKSNYISWPCTPFLDSRFPIHGQEI